MGCHGNIEKGEEHVSVQISEIARQEYSRKCWKCFAFSTINGTSGKTVRRKIKR